MTTLSRAALGCAITLICAGARAQTPGAGFKLLPQLPSSTEPSSFGKGVSEDGSVVVGSAWRTSSGRRAVRWRTQVGQIEELPTSEWSLSWANAVSRDGTTILGAAFPTTTPGIRPVLWRNGGLIALAGIGEATSGDADGISADGTQVGGYLYFPHTSPYPGVVRWDQGVPSDLSGLPGDALPSSCTAISADGQFLVGLGDAGGSRAIRVGDRVEDLGDLPGAQRGTGQSAEGVSHSGERVVGVAASAHYPFSESFLWSEPTGMIALGVLPATIQLSAAFSISDDGRIAGGASGTNRLYEYNAFLWDAIHGMRSLNTIVDAHGLDRDGWFIDIVYDLNSNGTVMTGMARKGAERRAFLVTLPPWCHADCDGSGDIDFNDFLCFLNRYNRAQADPRGNPIDFVYCDFALDDTIDFADVLEYLRLYSAGCGG
jgi:uncharacterized membrane protein